jgi:2-hydroxychromene-2-carboxylate isomerase
VSTDPQRVLALANAPEANAALMAETDAAREPGIFGSPTFVVGGELFWGDDRLDDAINWSRHGRVTVAR